MEAQLRLLSSPSSSPSSLAGATDGHVADPGDQPAPLLDQGGGSWRLSGTTRDVGRHGIARARAALRRARGTRDEADPAERRPSAA